MKGLKCADVIELLTEYMEGGLSHEMVRQVELHLSCDSCRSFLETLARTRDAVRGLREEDVPAECRIKLMRLIQRPDAERRSCNER